MGTVLWQKHPLLQSPLETLVAILLGAFFLLLAVPSYAAEQKIAEHLSLPHLRSPRHPLLQ